MFLHLTIDPIKSAEVMAKGVALEKHLNRALAVQAISWFSAPYTEYRDGELVFVFHYRWPDDRMFTSVLLPSQLQIVGDHISVIDPNDYIIHLPEGVYTSVL